MAVTTELKQDSPTGGSDPAPRPEPAHHALVSLLERLGYWLFAQLQRPRTRTTIVGLILILLGAGFITHSVWTFPLVIIGIMMVVVAWVGSRLEGRFAVEWSEMGAGFEMRARFKAAADAPLPQAPSLPAVVEVDPVIEGEAHTVEIDVEELRTLVAAADRAAASSDTAAVPVSWQQTAVGD